MMHKVDPMEIMLSDIFDKVFYSREKKPDYCWDCDGEGIVDVEVYRPHNVGRDVQFTEEKLTDLVTRLKMIARPSLAFIVGQLGGHPFRFGMYWLIWVSLLMPTTKMKVVCSENGLEQFLVEASSLEAAVLEMIDYDQDFGHTDMEMTWDGKDVTKQVYSMVTAVRMVREDT